ncbi:MAG: Na/Pi cotransporter family protein [Clostridia bacterium]|nr:Na/Pi cotransporter family protein [Clostridia bacterium]
MNLSTVFSLFGGLAFFLFGMRLMGEGLERAAGPRLKSFLGMMTRNRIVSILTGICVTALIQSSGATTVMVVGFVNAQLLTLAQSVGVIMGANIGTTVTSLLLSIEIDPGPIFGLIGILMIMAFKKETLKQAGMVSMGLGILFIGMDLMSASTEPLREWPVFLSMMQGVRNPLLGVLIGMVVTALLQSSSVSVGIVQVLAAGGLVGMDGALYLLLGAKIGACTPSLLSMANSRTAAKRTAMIHLLFNVISAALVLLISLFLPLTKWAQALVPANPKLCVSLMHISTSVICTFILMPFSDLLVKLSCLIIPEKQAEEKTALKMQYYDERLLKTPALASEQLYREVCRMGRETHDHLILACEALRTLDLTHEQEINDHEDLSDYLEEAITEGLVAVMPLELSEHDSKRIANLFHVVTDLERISDHAMNLMRLAKERIEKNAKLSDKADLELQDLFAQVMKILDTSLEGLEEWGIPDSIMALLEEEEQSVDDNTEALRKIHIDRLKEKKCTPKSGVIFLEAINNFERIADHAMNIASLAREDALHAH